MHDVPTPEDAAPRAERKTRLGRRVKRWLTRPWLALVRLLFPPVYCAYMWFVYRTSRVEHVNTDLLWALRARYGGLVGMMWHQEVFFVAWAFRRYEGHTLASRSDFGNIITAMLHWNGFVVFRGGSSKRKANKPAKRRVVPDMIEHMREVPGVAYGITCDGSQGPPYVMKKGSIQVAHACHKPLIVSRTWCKRRINLRGWDRAAIPLPFNHIVQAFVGPYFAPVDVDDPEVLEPFRQQLERELLELTVWAHRRVGERWEDVARWFPPGWEPTWGLDDELPWRRFEAPPDHPAALEEGAEPICARAGKRQSDAVERWEAVAAARA